MDAKHNQFSSFDEFWPFYLSEHSNRLNRQIHFFGSIIAVCYAAWALTQISLLAALGGLVIGYGAAWSGHFFVERNKPATFRYPLWSVRGDCKMIGLMFRGRLDQEIARIRALNQGFK